MRRSTRFFKYLIALMLCLGLLPIGTGEAEQWVGSWTLPVNAVPPNAVAGPAREGRPTYACRGLGAFSPLLLGGVANNPGGNAGFGCWIDADPNDLHASPLQRFEWLTIAPGEQVSWVPGWVPGVQKTIPPGALLTAQPPVAGVPICRHRTSKAFGTYVPAIEGCFVIALDQVFTIQGTTAEFELLVRGTAVPATQPTIAPVTAPPPTAPQQVPPRTSPAVATPPAATPPASTLPFDFPQEAGQIVGKAVNTCRPADASGISVYLLGRSFTAKTGATGDFVLNYVPRGAHTLVIELPPYPPLVLPNIQVSPAAVTNLGPRTIGTCSAQTGSSTPSPSPSPSSSPSSPLPTRPPAVPGELVITEIMAAPSRVLDTAGEWFEVYNPTSSALELMNLVVTDGAMERFTIGRSLVIPAGGFVVFGNNGDQKTNGGVPVNFVYSGFSLANSRDAIQIMNGTIMLDRVAYDAATFRVTAGKAMSLNPRFFNAMANDTPGNWCPAVQPFGIGDLGSPGAPNPNCP